MANKRWFVVGLMSGTSLDGLDMAYVQIERAKNDYSYKLLLTKTLPYSKYWKNRLRSAFHSSSIEIEIINKEFGQYLGDIVRDFLDESSIDNVDLIASHGHTVFHKPEEGFTLQIGDGHELYEKVNIPVVYDFRTQDVALGGQGAPLVPIGDRLFFSNYDYCLNLGGFANISHESKKGRLAFDICAVNIVLNHYANQLGLEYDSCGAIAASGSIDFLLLDALQDLPYYRQSVPKSLGYEFVETEILPLIDGFNLPVQDVLRTYSEHIVLQIAACFDAVNDKNVLITGGGALNTFLINELSSKSSVEIVVPDVDLVNFKEALIFALLAVLRVENKVNCLQSVTGAKCDHSSGRIIDI